MRCSSRVVAVWMALTAFTAANAHHSNSAFDMSREVELTGEVLRLDFRAPHVYLNIRDEEGQEWRIETDAPPIMRRSGWTRDSFSPGDRVTARVHPRKDGRRDSALLKEVEQSDGTVLASQHRIQQPTQRNTRERASSIFSGPWRGDLLPVSVGSRIPMIREFRDLALTEKGAAARAEFDETLMTETANCVSWPTPFILAEAVLHPVEFEQLSETEIVFRSEFYNTERRIYMDGREHPAQGDRTNQGYSVGTWEQDVLVVDTRLFAEHRSPYASSGIPSGLQKRTIERFQLVDDGARLHVSIYVEDPEYLVRPMEAELLWNFAPDQPLQDAACDAEVARWFQQ